jgi:hypothetical protein
LKYTLTSSQRLIKTYQNPKIEIYPSLFYKAGKDIKTPKLKYTLTSSPRLVKTYHGGIVSSPSTFLYLKKIG